MGKYFTVLEKHFSMSSVIFYSYKVYTVTPQNEVQALLLKSLEDVDAYDFWSDVRKPGYPSTVMVSPSEQENFKTFLTKYGVPYETLIEDVQT